MATGKVANLYSVSPDGLTNTEKYKLAQAIGQLAFILLTVQVVAASESNPLPSSFLRQHPASGQSDCLVAAQSLVASVGAFAHLAGSEDVYGLLYRVEAIFRDLNELIALNSFGDLVFCVNCFFCTIEEANFIAAVRQNKALELAISAGRKGKVVIAGVGTLYSKEFLENTGELLDFVASMKPSDPALVFNPEGSNSPRVVSQEDMYNLVPV